jgi:hypothetical protein
MHPILEALGFKTLHEPEDKILAKVLADNRLTLRSQQLMVEHFAEAAIKLMHPLERAALLKKVSPPPMSKTPVTWSAEVGPATGVAAIYGFCSRCKQDVAFGGLQGASKTFQWFHCVLGPSSIPAEEIENWRAFYIPPDPFLGRF